MNIQRWPLEVLTKKLKARVCACRRWGSGVGADYLQTWCYIIFNGASKEPSRTHAREEKKTRNYVHQESQVALLPKDMEPLLSLSVCSRACFGTCAASTDVMAERRKLIVDGKEADVQCCCLSDCTVH